MGVPGKTRGGHSHIWLQFAFEWELHVHLKVRTGGSPRMWVKGESSKLWMGHFQMKDEGDHS